MAKEMTKVNMEEGSRQVVQHKVTRVSITNTQDIGTHALTSQRMQERGVVLCKSLLDRVLVLGFGELLSCGHFVHEEVHHTLLSERPSEEGLILMHLSDDGGIVDEFDIASLEAGLHDIVAHHAQIIAAGLPKPVHDLEKLQHEIVLSQIVTALEKEFLKYSRLFVFKVVLPMCHFVDRFVALKLGVVEGVAVVV